MAPSNQSLPAQAAQFISTSTDNLDARSLSPYVNQDMYSWRAPSPPRIYIPPPGIECSPLIPASLSSDLTSDAENQAFLDKVTHGDYSLPIDSRDWTYEARRKAQPVLPFLYLAPYQAAKDRTFLEREGITMLLGVRERKSAAYMNPKVLTAELGIELVVTDVASHQELIAALPALTNKVNDHLLRVYERSETGKAEERKTGKVVLFCESGNERSAGVATAYLMSMYTLDLATAVQTVQAQRFCVTFDDSLKQWLLNYESILVAGRQVEAASGEVGRTRRALEREDRANPAAGVGASGGSRGKSKQKRGLMEIYDEEGDTEMGGTAGGAMDSDRFKERADWVPFGDKS